VRHARRRRGATRIRRVSTSSSVSAHVRNDGANSCSRSTERLPAATCRVLTGCSSRRRSIDLAVPYGGGGGGRIRPSRSRRHVAVAKTRGAARSAARGTRTISPRTIGKRPDTCASTPTLLFPSRRSRLFREQTYYRVLIDTDTGEVYNVDTVFVAGDTDTGSIKKLELG
jgi:hypothetical protein